MRAIMLLFGSAAAFRATSTRALTRRTPLRMLRIGDTAPDFVQKSSKGEISFHQWLGDSWGLLASHPADYTPVCTTELGRLANLMPEFEKRNVKVMALSCDDEDSHVGWSRDIVETQNVAAGEIPARSRE